MNDKIFSDDPLVHYKNSTVPPEQTKLEIENLLQQYGIKKETIIWNWNPPRTISLSFNITENINEKWQTVKVQIDCPLIWDRFNPRMKPPRPEMLNFLVSMRTLMWYIKSVLEANYTRQNSLIFSFMENVQVDKQHRFKDIAVPMLEQRNMETSSQKQPPKRISATTIEAEPCRSKELSCRERVFAKPSYLKR